MGQDAVHVKAVIFDLDGVIYRGRTAIPGGGKAVDWLRTQGRAAYFFTNNSTRTRESYVELLAGFGITSDTEHIVTSASLTAHYLQGSAAAESREPRVESKGHRRSDSRFPIPDSRKKVLVVGEGGLVEELRRAGLRVVRKFTPGVDVVVVGMDRRFTYAKLYEAQQALLAGAEFIATNRDATYPVEGNVIPGGGSVVAAVAVAAMREPITMGKPSRMSGLLITREAGVKPKEALMVGDRLETDIVGARRAGVWTVLVLTGISTLDEARAVPDKEKPHWVVASIADIPALVRELEAGRREPFDWTAEGVR